MNELLSSLLSLCMHYCLPCLDDYEVMYDFMSLYALWIFVDAKGGEKVGIKSRTRIIK